MKKWAHTRKHHVGYKKGDQVMIKLLLQQFLRKVQKGLVRREKWSFLIILHVDNVHINSTFAKTQDSFGFSREFTQGIPWRYRRPKS